MSRDNKAGHNKDRQVHKKVVLLIQPVVKPNGAIGERKRFVEDE